MDGRSLGEKLREFADELAMSAKLKKLEKADDK